MGITRISAYIIAVNEVEAEGYGPNEYGKWQGVISHGRNHPVHPFLWIISSDFAFDTHEAAVAAMRQAINEIREAVKNEPRGKQ